MLSIRWKFILSIGLTLLVTYLALLSWDYWWQRETAIQQMRQLVTDRATSLASDLNARVTRVETFVESVASAIERQPSPGAIPGRLAQFLRQGAGPGTAQWAQQLLVVFNPLFVQGTILPQGYQLALGRGAPESRDGRGTGSRAFGSNRDERSGAPDPPPDGMVSLTEFSRELEPFYARAVELRRGVWCDPYVVQGISPPPGQERNAPPPALATYSVPIIVDEKVIGVVAAAVSVPNLARLEPLSFGRGRGGRGGRRGSGSPDFAIRDARGSVTAPATEPSELLGLVRGFSLIDSEGRIIIPSTPRGQQRRSATPPAPPEPIPPAVGEPAGIANATQLAEDFDFAFNSDGAVLVHRVRDRAYLSDLVPGAVSGESYWVAFAPVGNTDWLLASAISESQYMNRFVQRLYQRGVFLVGGIIVLLGVTTFVAIRISRPIEKMAGAVRQLASGDLNAQVSGVNSRDEIGQLAQAFNTMTAQLRQHVAALTEQTAARQSVEAELRIARQIQSDLLPRKFPPFPDRKEFELHAINVAAKRVAGDFYDFFFAPNGMLTITIADVAGKGMPAALLMAVTRTIIRNLAMEGHSPAQIVERANALLVQDITNSMFVTLFLLQYDTRTGRIMYVNAGHPHPYRFGNNDSPHQFGEVTGAILGVSPNGGDWAFEERQERLEVGETLLLYTDGVTEARAPDNTMLRDAGLEQLIIKYGDQSAEAICNKLVEEVSRFQNGQQADDITLLAFRRTN